MGFISTHHSEGDPSEGKIHPDWPWVSPNLLQGVSGPLPEVKQPGHGADHNHPSAEVRSRAIHLLPFCTFMTGYRRNLLSPQHYYKQSNFSLHLQIKNNEQNSEILLTHIHRVLYMVDGVCVYVCMYIRQEYTGKSMTLVKNRARRQHQYMAVKGTYFSQYYSLNLCHHTHYTV